MREDIQVTRSFSTGECWSDYRLILSKVNFTNRSPIQNNRTWPVRKVDETKLRNNDSLTSFQTTRDNKLARITGISDIEST